MSHSRRCDITQSVIDLDLEKLEMDAVRSVLNKLLSLAENGHRPNLKAVIRYGLKHVNAGTFGGIYKHIPPWCSRHGGVGIWPPSSGFWRYSGMLR